MKRVALMAALAGSMAVTGCATNPYGSDPYYGRGQNTTGRAAQGGVAGAAVGAGLGAIIPGVSTVEGAIAGGIAGAVLGATVNGRQYYRDTRGYCYYVDQYGRPVYNYNTRC